MKKLRLFAEMGVLEPKLTHMTKVIVKIQEARGPGHLLRAGGERARETVPNEPLSCGYIRKRL